MTRLTTSGKPPAIARLYQTFARFDSSLKTMAACSCCVTRDEVEALFSAPLAQLPPNRLQRYAFKAISTWGDENDFKHFLPRLLELALKNDLIGDSLAFGFEKAGWPSWAEVEVEAVRAFWPFAVESALQNESFALVDWFALWVSLNEDLAPLLLLLERASDQVFLDAATCIAWDIGSWSPSL